MAKNRPPEMPDTLTRPAWDRLLRGGGEKWGVTGWGSWCGPCAGRGGTSQPHMCGHRGSLTVGEAKGLAVPGCHHVVAMVTTGPDILHGLCEH